MKTLETSSDVVFDSDEAKAKQMLHYYYEDSGSSLQGRTKSFVLLYGFNYQNPDNSDEAITMQALNKDGTPVTDIQKSTATVSPRPDKAKTSQLLFYYCNVDTGQMVTNAPLVVNQSKNSQSQNVMDVTVTPKSHYHLVTPTYKILRMISKPMKSKVINWFLTQRRVRH
ncbi:hypothetical protein [Limosilactobacillus sp.]|nr:hypothetical protein [Limosilactobacillus sp.]MCH3922663.1 hypothetical protein [Limosilactobacillus sp.]